MAVELNHTIVWCTDKVKSATFLAEMLGRPAPRAFLHFLVVDMDNGVSLDFYQQDEKPKLQHYAFLVGETEFDQVVERIKQKRLDHWADPARTQAGQINQHWGGRGVYFEDPDGHLLEAITKPYGDPNGIVQKTTKT
jgi:catechol 2,3-dioxygenase-like lactoylglutathione lyase family enzyme